MPHNEDDEVCQRCGAEGPDLRTLWHACFYAMDELGLPFDQRQLEGRTFYTLRVCKTCRADWMMVIHAWFQGQPLAHRPEADIPVRDLGAVRYVTAEEYEQLYPGRTPYRLRREGGSDG